MDLEDALIRYIEHPAQGEKEGTLTFTAVNGRMLHISNISENIERHPMLTLSTQSRFMDAAPLYATLAFDMARARSGHFSVDAELGSMDGTVLNSVLVPLAGVRIESAEIDGVVLDLRGNNDQCSGDVSLFYRGLKFNILKLKDGEEVKNRKLLSFLAGAIFMVLENTNNDRNTDPKRVSYQRDPQKGIFNLIWKTIFEGIQETVKGTRLDELTRKVKKDPEKRSKRKEKTRESRQRKEKD